MGIFPFGFSRFCAFFLPEISRCSRSFPVVHTGSPNSQSYSHPQIRLSPSVAGTYAVARKSRCEQPLFIHKTLIVSLLALTVEAPLNDNGRSSLKEQAIKP
jgi:hypothetical protein